MRQGCLVPLMEPFCRKQKVKEKEGKYYSRGITVNLKKRNNNLNY
jgi:hypothetical protein